MGTEHPALPSTSQCPCLASCPTPQLLSHRGGMAGVAQSTSPFPDPYPKPTPPQPCTSPLQEVGRRLILFGEKHFNQIIT